ncbi:tyrosine-type recombinase/integrase [Rhizobium oryzihabitans]|uniref:tyrosine-type recombinase/integrase n=1 Tax=Rhizobium oryzihabitans TaxID=2267833 RepID=UPI00403585EA
MTNALELLKVSATTGNVGGRNPLDIFYDKIKTQIDYAGQVKARKDISTRSLWFRKDGAGYLFPSRRKMSHHLSTRQYARIVHRWVASIGLDANAYGTHSMRRTKAVQIYKKTGNLRAVQILLGHTKLESTVRYLGVEVEDALRIAEQIEL